jgi:hypothetical protein
MIKGNKGEGTSSKKEVQPIEDTELESRVKKWLVESGPPDAVDILKPNKYQLREHHQYGARQNTTFKHDSRRHLHSNHRSPRSSDETPAVVSSVLYHPDFADWKTCGLAADASAEKRKEPTPEQNGSVDLFRVFDDAQASLSLLLSAPFGEPCFTDPGHAPD